MTETLMLSMQIGRARSSFDMNCQHANWLGSHDAVATGAVEYSPTTTAKRNAPGNLVGALT